MAGDQGQDAAGLQGVDATWRRRNRAATASGRDSRASRRQTARCRSRRRPAAACVSRKFSMRMSARGAGRGRCGRRCESSSTPMNRMPAGGLAHEIARAAARLQHGGVVRHAEAARAPRAWPCMTTGEVKNWREGGALGASRIPRASAGISARRRGPASRRPCSGR